MTMRALRLLGVLATSAVVGAVVAVTTRPGEVACGVMLPREYHGPPVTCPRPGIRCGLVVLAVVGVVVTGLLVLGLTSARVRHVSD